MIFIFLDIFIQFPPSSLTPWLMPRPRFRPQTASEVWWSDLITILEDPKQLLVYEKNWLEVSFCPKKAIFLVLGPHFGHPYKIF